MNDCPNAEIRDQLPDLLHERLDPSARAAVTAHVAACGDCRDELELLRGIHGMLIERAPRIDVAAVVAALPKPAAREIRAARPRRTWADWRVAAAVTLLVAGGTSVAVYRHGAVDVTLTPGVTAESISRNPSANNVAPLSASGTATPPNRTPAETLAQVSGEEGAESGPAVSSVAVELNDRQMQALLDDINRLEAVPITDPEPVSIRITPKTPVTPNGRGSE